MQRRPDQLRGLRARVEDHLVIGDDPIVGQELRRAVEREDLVAGEMVRPNFLDHLPVFPIGASCVGGAF